MWSLPCPWSVPATDPLPGSTRLQDTRNWMEDWVALDRGLVVEMVMSVIFRRSEPGIR